MPSEAQSSLPESKFLKDAIFQEDFVTSLENVIQEGFAEKVPSEDLCRADGRVWYIPHHGEYHSKKPEKIRVVFDFSAQFQGMSLTSELLQGPDLTNNLVGILLRFPTITIGFNGRCTIYVSPSACSCGLS